MVLEELDDNFLDFLTDFAGSPTKGLNLQGTPNKGRVKEDFEAFFRDEETLAPLAKQVSAGGGNGHRTPL